MGHADGLCTVFLDESADVETAVRVVVDSKGMSLYLSSFSSPSLSLPLSLSLSLFPKFRSLFIQISQTDYPAACNSAEILLVHASLPHSVWAATALALLSAGVELRCDASSLSILQSSPEVSSHPNFSEKVKPANLDTDYDTEFLDLILAVHTTTSLSTAIDFINYHSSHHTDAIITSSSHSAQQFTRAVDSASTFTNASTRFADGFRYGFGTEVGISTGRIHARGPVGLEGLVIYKYVMVGRGEGGHVVGEMGVGEGKRAYKHAKLGLDSRPEFDL